MVALMQVCPACPGPCQDSPRDRFASTLCNCDIFGHMAANLRFSTAIEALALMATEPEKFHTSQALAKVLATNPVVIRRLLSVLSRAGLVTSAKGPSGSRIWRKVPSKLRFGISIVRSMREICCIRPHTVPLTRRN